MVKITSTTTAMLTSMKTTVEESKAWGMEEEDVELRLGIALPEGVMEAFELA